MGSSTLCIRGVFFGYWRHSCRLAGRRGIWLRLGRFQNKKYFSCSGPAAGCVWRFLLAAALPSRPRCASGRQNRPRRHCQQMPAFISSDKIPVGAIGPDGTRAAPPRAGGGIEALRARGRPPPPGAGRGRGAGLPRLEADADPVDCPRPRLNATGPSWPGAMPGCSAGFHRQGVLHSRRGEPSGGGEQEENGVSVDDSAVDYRNPGATARVWVPRSRDVIETALCKAALAVNLPFSDEWERFAAIVGNILCGPEDELEDDDPPPAVERRRPTLEDNLERCRYLSSTRGQK